MSISDNKINLILQGGGIKGLAYIGALRCLENNGYKIKNIAGSSVGAIIGSLIIAGYNSYELEEIINNLNVNIFFNSNKLKEKIKNKGLYSLSELEKFLENMLLKKNIRVFSDIKIGNNYKAIFTTTSIKYQRIFVLPYDLKLININPDTFSVAKAAIMSASIPLFYEPYKLNNNYFYDGGVSDNFPKWCFNTGLALKVTNEKPLFDKLRQNIFGKINNNNSYIDEIYINCYGYKATDFIKGFNNKYDLYNRGYKSIENYLRNTKTNNI